ncbi:MAG: hypothetical protein DWI02_12945 [Planctomycetota bacterium]|nr:MAG: hypothetical protein DWI02_12945 [Planctomycetota bacterium]
MTFIPAKMLLPNPIRSHQTGPAVGSRCQNRSGSAASSCCFSSSHSNPPSTRLRWLAVWLVLGTLAAGIVRPVTAADDPDSDDPVPTNPVTKSKGGDGELQLLKYSDLELPTAGELLQAKPFDWIVLKTMDVLVVEPVGPRPETLVILNNEYERHLKGKASFTEGVEKLKERRKQLQRLPLTLLDPGPDQDPDYVLETKFIQKIEYFEDLVLRRANLLIDEEAIPLAYDLLLFVDRRNRENNLRFADAYQSNKQDEAAAATAEERFRYTLPAPPPLKISKSWPRFDETSQKLLFKDAALRSQRGDHESALLLLEDLWDRNRSYADLSASLGAVVDRLITDAVGREDFRQSRFFLRRLTDRDPQHPIAEKWRATLAEKTSTLIAAARSAATDGDAVGAALLVDRAARIWPDTAGLKEAHRELNDRFQSVRLGVLRLPGEQTSYPFEAAAEAAVNGLTLQPLFEPVRVDERGVRYRSTVMESWEPKDLGRQVQFTLRLKRADWEARPVITAADIQHELSARIDPTTSVFDARLAGAIERVDVQSPSQFTIFFRRLPLRLESLFPFPVSVTDPQALNPDPPTAALTEFGRQRFYEFRREDKQIAYRRVRPQPANTKTRHVDEIVAVRYDSWEHALQGLLRGEVVGLPQVDLHDVKGLQDDNRFFVQPYALPVSHLIVFNPDSPPLRDGQLRRALTLALPREELVEKAILSGASKQYARVTSSPFPTNSYGFNRMLRAPPYDPQRAAALTMTAKKHLGSDLPVLHLVCAPDPQVHAAATEMIEHWRRVGITVQLVDPQADLTESHWDLAYRSTRIVEPLSELWPLLTVHGGTSVESLRPLPERVRRQLLDLEQVNDWGSAISLLQRIETELLIETRYIPLWEIDEFFVTRRNLIGLPPRLMHAFHDVERWTLQSWYPQENP